MKDQITELSFKDQLLQNLVVEKETLGKGVIIETGAGNPLYTILCSQAYTASKLVKYASSPTDFEYTKSKYSLDQHTRAISPETVRLIIEKEKSLNPEVDWIFANSIQIGNVPEVQTHGWIAYLCKDKFVYYHFTINNHLKYNRIELLDLIEQISLDVLLSKNVKNITSGYIDQVFNGNILDLSDNVLDPNEYAVLDNLIEGKLINENCDDTYACYYDGQFHRFNDFIRSVNKNIVIFKGSFNPLHEMHYEMYNSVINDDTECVFVISINNREPIKKVSSENLAKRIYLLSRLNIRVIINTRGYFDDFIYFYQGHQECNDKLLTFLVGDDTMKRIIDDNVTRKFHWTHVHFIVVTRNQAVIKNSNYSIEYVPLDVSGVSSTEIRKVISDKSGDLDNMYQNKDLLNLVKMYFNNE